MSDFTRAEAVQYIIKEVCKAKKETSDKEVKRMHSLLEKATNDDVFRTADIISRFGTETILEIIG